MQDLAVSLSSSNPLQTSNPVFTSYTEDELDLKKEEGSFETETKLKHKNTLLVYNNFKLKRQVESLQQKVQELSALNIKLAAKNQELVMQISEQNKMAVEKGSED